MLRFNRFAWLIAISALPAAPAEPMKFTATLDSIKIQARPGQVVNRTFSLTLDPGQKKAYFRSHVSDWWRSEDGSESFYAESGTLSRSCGRWVAINPVEAAISGGETLNVRLTVVVPPAIQPGGYWCALTVDQLPDPEARSEGVQIDFLASMSVGIFIYIDPVQRSARIRQIDILNNEAKVILHNDGNAPLGVEGRFEFVRPGEQTPAAVLPVARQTVLPEPVTTSILKTALPDASALPSGDYLVRVILDIGLNHYIGAQRKLEVRR